VLVWIFGSSRRRTPVPRAGGRPASAVPYGLVFALLITVILWIAYFALDALIPLPRDGAHVLIRGFRVELRNDLVRGLAFVPTLVGCLWLFRLPLARHGRLGLILLATSVLSLIRVLEALLISLIAPGTVIGSAPALRWGTEEAYSPSRLTTWATLLTLLVTFVGWRAWRRHRV
jgi:hypothetical protein